MPDEGVAAFDVERSMLNVECSNWFLLRSGKCAPAFNMALDDALLEAMPRLQQPVLRFYGWTEPAASFGYFQKFSEVAGATLLRPLVRRPTGGGIVPHDADWTYSFAFPISDGWYSLKAVESYQRVHEWIQKAFARLNIATELAPCCKKSLPGQCFVGHETSDLLWHGEKIAGAAQRRTRDGLLIQGSVQPPPVPLACADWETALSEVARQEWGRAGAEFVPDGLLLQRVKQLTKEKYAATAYNQKR